LQDQVLKGEIDFFAIENTAWNADEFQNKKIWVNL